MTRRKAGAGPFFKYMVTIAKPCLRAAGGPLAAAAARMHDIVGGIAERGHHTMPRTG